jgi:uncharacterized protein
LPASFILRESFSSVRTPRRTPTADSDVDLLVIMPGDGKTPRQQALEIRQKVTVDFPIDLLVRSPEEVQKRMGMNDWFMHDIMREGITLYAG